MDINNCIADNCLKGLVSLKSSCVSGNCTPYFLEDLEGIDLSYLTSTASAMNLSAEQYAKQVIDTATRLMLGDLQMLLNAGFSLIESFAETCSSCVYLNTFQAGGGVIIRNTTGSKFSLMKVSKVEINVNATGAQNLVFDDGLTVQKFHFTAMGANVVSPVLIDYTTNAETVKVYIEDQNVQLASINCAKTSGCGCSGGGATVSRETSVSYSGYLLGMATTQQYGFRICANIVCSYDVVTCQMVKALPNIFGLTLLYKIGSLIYLNTSLSKRNNRYAGVDQEQQESMGDYYESLYQQRLKGTSSVKGLQKIINDYLRTNKDACVQCNTSNSLSYAVG